MKQKPTFKSYSVPGGLNNTPRNQKIVTYGKSITFVCSSNVRIKDNNVRRYVSAKECRTYQGCWISAESNGYREDEQIG